MTINKLIIKQILIAIYTLIGIGALLSSIYLILLTAFGIGWGGGKTTWTELIWKWKGIILISIYSFTTSVGLFKIKKIGIIFGYTIPLGFLAFLLRDYLLYGWNQETSFTVIDFFWSLIYFGIPITMILGLNKLKKTFSDFKISEYITSVVLTIFLIISFHFMFD